MDTYLLGLWTVSYTVCKLFIEIKIVFFRFRTLDGEFHSTLGSGIVVLVGIFARINKCTGGNKRTGGPFY